MTDVVWPDIEPDFKQQLRSLIPLLLAPEQLVVKKIHGTRISGKQLLEYFKVYIKIYQGDELPEPKSMLEVATHPPTAVSLRCRATRRACTAFFLWSERVSNCQIFWLVRWFTTEVLLLV